MRTLDEFTSLLGRPLRNPHVDVLERVIGQWNVQPPRSFLEIVSAYGDSEIGGFIVLYGPDRIGGAGTYFGPYLHDWETSQDSIPVLPAAGGMILWAHTIESDQLCLRRREDGRWTVSVSLRNWYEWRHSDKEFSDWLFDALSGESELDWLPEWGSLPLEVKDISSEPSSW